MNTGVAELLDGFRRTEMATIKGSLTRHVITLNANKDNPGEKLYIGNPKLKQDRCLVPARQPALHVQL